jgi:hypothetical protein
MKKTPHKTIVTDRGRFAKNLGGMTLL